MEEECLFSFCDFWKKEGNSCHLFIPFAAELISSSLTLVTVWLFVSLSVVFFVSFRLVFSGTTECLWRKRKQPHMTDERIQRRRIIWLNYPTNNFHVVTRRWKSDGIKVKGLQPQTVHHRDRERGGNFVIQHITNICECLYKKKKKWRMKFTSEKKIK